jgi:hypothetical protein
MWFWQRFLELWSTSQPKGQRVEDKANSRSDSEPNAGADASSHADAGSAYSHPGTDAGPGSAGANAGATFTAGLAVAALRGNPGCALTGHA